MWSLIYASTIQNGIGINNKLPWYIPSDLAHFKRITTSGENPIIVMGASTFASIGRPLPKRINVVLSTRPKPENVSERVVWMNTVEQVEEFCESRGGNVFVIGGSQIYKLFLSKCQKVYHTLVKGNYQCDVFWSLEGEWESVSVEETSEADYRELVRISR